MMVVRLEVDSLVLATEMANSLRGLPEVDEVSVQNEEEWSIGVESVALTILGGAWLLTKIIDWWRARSESLLVIDTRYDDVLVTEHPELTGHRGKVVVIAKDGTQVKIETPEVVNFDEVTRALEQLGTSSAVKMVEEAGSITSVLDKSKRI